MLTGVVDVLGILAVLRATDWTEHFIFHDLGKSEDCIERRAQLVAHRGEEL